jgi:hypothetical protein
MHKVFVSYVFEDHAYRDQVVDWAKKGLLGAIEVVFERDDVRRQGEAAIKAQLRPIMSSASVALVLVGQDTHDRKWVDEEVHYCASAGKPVIWARLPNTTGAPPPELRAKAPVSFAPAGLRDGLATATASMKR